MLHYSRLSSDQGIATEYIIPTLELKRKQGDDMDAVLLSMTVSPTDTRAITGKLAIKSNEASQ